MTTNHIVILISICVFISCAPSLFISNEFGRADVIEYPDSTKKLLIVGIGITPRDGSTKVELENKAKDHNLTIKKEAIKKLSNQDNQSIEKLLKCIYQNNKRNTKLKHMSDGTIEAVDTLSDSELKSILKCITE